MIFAFKTLLIFSKPKNVSFCVKTTVALRSSSLPLEILIYGLVYRYLILFDINLKFFGTSFSMTSLSIVNLTKNLKKPLYL